MKRAVGVVALVLDLGLVGCVQGVVNLDDDWDHKGNAEASAAFSETVPLTDQSHLRLVGANGSIQVRGVPGSESVVLEAVRRVRSDTYSDARAHLSKVKVSIATTRAVVEIKTLQPDHSAGRTYIVDYEILVPDHILHEIINGNGPVQVEGLFADVDVKNGNGDVVLSSIVGSAWVSLGNGSVHSSVQLPSGGQIRHAVGNGSISLSVQRLVSATFGAKVGNGTITMAGLSLQNTVSTPRQLHGTLGAAAGVIDLSLGNGQIRVEGS
jgi:hypothetical protein